MKRRRFLQQMGLGVLVEATSRRSPTDQVLEQIRGLNREFPAIGIYQRPNDQDRQSAGSGFGIYPCRGKLPCAEMALGLDPRSESVYLPFVMATRRQTDGLVRQAYWLLPAQVRRRTAFVIADRLLQFPEAYLPYLRQRSQVVLIGSFFGIGAIQNSQDYEATDDGTGTRSFHRMQLRQLEYSIALIRSLNKPIVDIVYGMGDSLSDYALVVRDRLRQESTTILRKAGMPAGRFSLEWGADELVFKAFARQLPSFAVQLVMANPEARHHYDANRTTAEILRRTLAGLNLQEFTPQGRAAGSVNPVRVYVFDRHPQAPSNFNQPFSPQDGEQAQFDQAFGQQLAALSPAQQARAVIIDGRNPNGALNPDSMPLSDQYLAFGSWGTFANVCGQTLGMAKLLLFAQRPAVQRQLLLEAIAHDIFCIGYATAQNPGSPFRQALVDAGLRYLHKDSPGSDLAYDLAEMVGVFGVMNAFVNQQMRLYLPHLRGAEFVVTPQLWRTFEAQVLLRDGSLPVGGVFRKDLPAPTFDPRARIPQIIPFTLQTLMAPQ